MQSDRKIPLITVKGTHFEIGQQIGKQFSDEIKASNGAMIRDAETNKGITRDAIITQVRTYNPYVEKYTPHLVDELKGLADGAGITYDEALLLQCRFEVVGYAGVYKDKKKDGCTSFAITKEKTASDQVLIGQNADINEYIEKTLKIVHFIPDDGPRILMASYYPGMIGWLGINSEGMACFGNAVLSPGWRPGFPRYFTLRKVLESTTVKDAIKFINDAHTASTINVIMADKTGDTKDVEIGIDKSAVIEPVGGVIAHANHYLDLELQKKDLLLPVSPNSPLRYGQMLNRLLQLVQKKENVTMDACKEILCDHTNFPHSICYHVEKEDPLRLKTIMSIVANPEDGYFDVCWGNPCMNSFFTYKV